MKDLKDMNLNQVVNNQATVNTGSMQVINQVFNTLKRMFPAWRNSITSAKEEAEIKLEWLKALKQEGLTTQKALESGLGVARTHSSPYWPSCGQFIEWCKEPKQRVNEAMYKEHSILKALPKHTKDEYADIAKKGAAACRAVMK